VPQLSAFFIDHVWQEIAVQPGNAVDGSAVQLQTAIAVVSPVDAQRDDGRTPVNPAEAIGTIIEESLLSKYLNVYKFKGTVDSGS
jgi:hypothetical protein